MRAAGGTLALLLILGPASQAAAFEVKYSDEGLPLRWAPGEVLYHIDPQGKRPGSAAAFARTIDAAFAAWAAHDETRLDLAPGPDAPGGFGYELGAANASVVRYEDDDWEYDHDALMLTFTHYRVADGAILDADILINGVDHRWRTDGQPAQDDDGETFDLQNALTHEVGHFLGLAHSPDHPEAAMYPSVAPGEVSKRALAADDAAGLDFLYVDRPTAGTTGPSGCSAASGAPTRLGLLLLLLGALAACRHRRRRLAARRPRGPVALWLALVALTGGSAGATTLRYRPVEELARGAAVVVQGRVVEVRAHRLGRLIVTDTTVRVARCLRGACGTQVVIRQLGGQVGGLGLHVEGAFRARPGDELVLLLRARGAGVFEPLGMTQGAFRVERPRGRPPVAVRDLDGVALAPRAAARPRPRPRQALPLEEIVALVRATEERSPR